MDFRAAKQVIAVCCRDTGTGTCACASHLVVIQVVERSYDGYHAGVFAIHMFDALEGIGRILLHKGQVEAGL